ncbi:MAG: hypothetical protein ACLVEF_06005 [Bifidobacterium bifidum]
MKGATTAASIPASHTTDPVTPTHAHDQQQPVAPSIPVRTQPSANTPMTTTNPAARQVPDFALRKGGPPRRCRSMTRPPSTISSPPVTWATSISLIFCAEPKGTEQSWLGL